VLAGESSQAEKGLPKGPRGSRPIVSPHSRAHRSNTGALDRSGGIVDKDGKTHADHGMVGEIVIE
jgi:hypothetical protein